MLPEELYERPAATEEDELSVAWKSDFLIVGNRVWVRLYRADGSLMNTRLGFERNDALGFARVLTEMARQIPE